MYRQKRTTAVVLAGLTAVGVVSLVFVAEKYPAGGASIRAIAIVLMMTYAAVMVLINSRPD